MTKAAFIGSIDQAAPPAGLDPLLLSLWYDAKNDWHKAHEIVQGLTSRAAEWIHAYLHRKEGDFINAKYWYMKAQKDMPEIEFDLEAEWNNILDSLEELL